MALRQLAKCWALSPGHSRSLATSLPASYKDIVHKEEGTKIVVEGVTIPSPHAGKVVTEGCREGKQHCHPFCRSPVVGQVGRQEEK